MITASLRASATLALRMPARLASRIAQLLSCEQPRNGLEITGNYKLRKITVTVHLTASLLRSIK